MGIDRITKKLNRFWQFVSELGIHLETDTAEIKRIIMMNRMVFIGAILILPFVHPSVNPTNTTFGWIEFCVFVGFLFILLLNSCSLTEIGKWLLLLTLCFKIFFSASIRGVEGGEQFFIFPIVLGILLFHDLRKLWVVLISVLCTVGTYSALELTNYSLFLDESIPEAAIREVYLVNSLIAVTLVFLIGIHYFRLTQTQHELLEAKNQQLLDAKKEAEAATKAKSEFLSVMSHEIRTPMNAVIGMTSLLKETKLSKEQKEYFQTIKTSGESLLQIINDILDFSKIEAGMMTLEMQTFESAGPVQDTFLLLQTSAKNKGLTLTYEIDPAIPRWIVSDPTRLRQVLVNLVSNAIKFTATGSVHIQVSLLERNGNGITIRYAIKDTGIGIPSDRVDRLFKSFSQVDASTTRKYGGTGLGLAISKQIVELLGGKITVQSEAGMGSEFSFTMQAQKGIAPTSEQIGKKKQAPIPNQKPEIRILVAEDNAVNQKVARQILKKIGFDTDIVANGLEAVNALSLVPYDLVFMDMQMPEMDGIEATEHIRVQHPKGGPSSPIIIAMTANVTSQDRKKCLKAGMDDFLPKPIKKKDLEEAIAKWFSADMLHTSSL